MVSTDVISDVLSDIKKNSIRIAFVYALSVNEPLGIGYLSAYLKRYLPNIEIRFFNPLVDPVSVMMEFKPTFILYSMMSVQFDENMKRNQRLKKELPPYISVMGGSHPTYFPDMIKESGIDIICRGEGERALKALIERASSGSNILDIKGLWIKNNGEEFFR